MAIVEFVGRIGAKGSDVPRKFRCRVIRRPKYGGGDETRTDSDAWQNSWKKVEAALNQYILVTPLAEVEALIWCGEQTRGIITETGGYHAHLLKVKREEVAERAYAHQVVIVGAKGIYDELRNGDEVEVELFDDDTAKIRKVSE